MAFYIDQTIIRQLDLNSCPFQNNRKKKPLQLLVEL